MERIDPHQKFSLEKISGYFLSIDAAFNTLRKKYDSNRTLTPEDSHSLKDLFYNIEVLARSDVLLMQYTRESQIPHKDMLLVKLIALDAEMAEFQESRDNKP